MFISVTSLLALQQLPPFASSASVPFSFLVPLTASPLQSCLIPSSSALLHLSLSIRSQSPLSLGSQSIYYSAKWAYQLSRVLPIEAVTDNE